MLSEVIDELQKITPEIANNRLKIMSWVKAHAHSEKYSSWFMFRLHFIRGHYYKPKPKTFIQKIMYRMGWVKRDKAESFYKYIDEFSSSKQETHDHWQNPEVCYKWGERYFETKPTPDKKDDNETLR